MLRARRLTNFVWFGLPADRQRTPAFAGMTKGVVASKAGRVRGQLGKRGQYQVACQSQLSAKVEKSSRLTVPSVFMSK